MTVEENEARRLLFRINGEKITTCSECGFTELVAVAFAITGQVCESPDGGRFLVIHMQNGIESKCTMPNLNFYTHRFPIRYPTDGYKPEPVQW